MIEINDISLSAEDRVALEKRLRAPQAIRSLENQALSPRVGSKAIWTLNIDNYAPRIREITYPLIQHYAKKIGAEFRTITERRWPEMPPVYEKLQVHELGKEFEWNIYIDSDTLVHPDMFDVTFHLGKDTVCHNGKDMAGFRWTMDEYFMRDGRSIGSCNWFAVASHWCLDLWKPLEDLTLAEAVARIHPIVNESNGLIIPEHLIDDYTLSRNIARFGLKFKTVQEICTGLGFAPGLLFHLYNVAEVEKVSKLRQMLKDWGVDR